MDLQFNEASEVCQQRLYITDGNTNSEIACGDNNQFKKRTIYNNTESSIEIRLDNTATAPTGKIEI